MPDPLIHVAIVEDDPEIRQTLALIINGTPGFSCIFSYADCESAIADLPGHFTDVVLMDIELPGITGIEGVKRLRPQMPRADFIMLTIRHDDEAIFESLCAGATGYLVKDTPPAELLDAIREVRQGGAPMSAAIARKVIRSFRQTSPSPLSDRETEILRLLSDGQHYRSIAEQLFLSPHTVKTHIKNIYEKLQVHSRAEAVRKALGDKLI
ncbi:MAG: response regulator transcription factor [Lewinellaceae bacterium]|jgi:DNA-binding NarL/FixJ family response regulator|nr:response regulator transcription factor [Lewinellaceae bacterium]